MKRAVTGDNVARVQDRGGVLGARKGADPASRLAHQKSPGGDIPGVQMQLPEPVEATTRGVCEIERRRAQPSQSRGLKGHRRPVLDVVVGNFVAIVGEARGQNCLANIAGA